VAAYGWQLTGCLQPSTATWQDGGAAWSVTQDQKWCGCMRLDWHAAGSGPLWAGGACERAANSSQLLPGIRTRQGCEWQRLGSAGQRATPQHTPQDARAREVGVHRGRRPSQEGAADFLARAHAACMGPGVHVRPRREVMQRACLPAGGCGMHALWHCMCAWVHACTRAVLTLSGFAFPPSLPAFRRGVVLHAGVMRVWHRAAMRAGMGGNRLRRWGAQWSASQPHPPGILLGVRVRGAWA